MSALAILRSFCACDDALRWVAAQPDQSPQALWLACERGDWLAWYLGRLGQRDGYGSPAHRRAVLISCLCARTASRWWRDPESERAVSLAEQWAWGDETITRARLRSSYADASAYATASAAYVASASAAYVAAAYATASRETHLADLADLIRAAVTEVPS